MAAKTGVILLKPNLGELSSLLKKKEIQHNEVGEAARQLIAQGFCEVMVVSPGAGGAMLVTKNEEYHVVAPVFKKLSTVGTGDSMVAGLVFILSRGMKFFARDFFGALWVVAFFK